MRNITPRKEPVSNNWRKLVLNRLGFHEKESTKEINKLINDLWKQGYSHKYAVYEFRKVMRLED